MIVHLSYVLCDGCADPAQVAGDAKEARLSAQAEGWVRREGKDLCPKCRKTTRVTPPEGGKP